MPLIVIAAVALLVGIDQLIKLWASQTLAAVGNIPVIEGVLAGGVGNLIDRIWHGYVVDMFYFKLIDFAVFNFADVCVVVGCIWLILSILFVPDAIRWRKAPSIPEGENGGETHADSK